ncbi:MAG TPA: DHA2 family efflux MFS transporter permease subunit [Acetobacteraceae bacterium]|nr:DHA2 family efflux MFS transporter permease subunit [Acetobacteraceae bacterium]
MSGSADHADWRPRHNPWIIAIVVTVAAFMEVLDTTIVNVSLPHIAGSLSSSYDDATWALTSYLVANGIVLTISGWLSDVFGRKRYFMICIGMFTVCSLLCGLSQSLPELIIFRLAQGFFGGGLQPNQQSILLDTFDANRRGQAMGVVAVATVVAPILGPTLGGYITDNISWRWIFFINIPIGILGVIGVGALVEDPPWVTERRSHGIDYVGIGLITLGLGSLQVALDRGQDADWLSSSFIRVMFLLAFLGILGAVGWLITTERPVVNLRVLMNRNFALGATLVGCMSFVLYSSAVVMPQFAQQVIGYTATQAGLILSPGGVVIILLIPIVTRILPLVPTRYLVAFGFTAMGFALLFSSVLVPQIAFRHLALMRIAQTTGLAFLFVPISTIAYSTVPRDLNGDAAALYTMFRNVIGSIGISTATALIQQRLQVREAHLADWMTPLYQPFKTLLQQTEATLLSQGHAANTVASTATGVIYQTFITQAEVLAYGDVFRLCAIASFCIVPLTFLFSNYKPTPGARAPAAH